MAKDEHYTLKAYKKRISIIDGKKLTSIENKIIDIKLSKCKNPHRIDKKWH
jgi:hypothetical protein